MPINKYADDLFLIQDMEALASAYEEISVMKMQQIRKQVLSTRSFMEGVSEVFYHVRSSYKNQIEQLMKKNKKQSESLTFSTVANNGRQVIVLLSANAKLYGDIISKTFSLFINEIKNADADIAIVGELGKEMYESSGLNKPYTYFELPDITVTFEDLKSLITYVGKYQTVKVYYGQFENVLTQTPKASIVSGQQALNENQQASNTLPQESFRFFFEPSLQTILHFFETQLFSSLVKQTMSEHELARYASRINAMEQAVGNIHKRKGQLLLMQKRAKNNLDNTKQRSTLSGISFWQTKHI